LKRFFLKVAGGFQVSKTIRDLCVFAEQDVTKDPPCSKLDLVCCRNLLIYLGSVLQRKVLQIFHYALQPHGYLMLGTSETIGSQAELFRLLDKKNKIYARKSAIVPIHYEFAPRAFFAGETPLPTGAERPQPYIDLHHEAEHLLLAQYAPPGVVISRDMEILHFFGETGPYLNPTPGSASLNLLKMARQELAAELRALVHKVGREGKPLRREGVRMRLPGGETTVDLRAIPLSGPVAEESCLLVLFEENRRPAEEKAPKQVAQTGTADQDRVRELEQELSTSREYMQSIIEEQEATNEELKSANEEIQSTNEELQSTNEELETAKEELQSTNEELATVNEELENRNIDLGAANNDLTNLLASVNLPILMLGQDLRIRQFTPQAEKLFNLIETDVGRPIGQIRANVEVPNLEALVSEVIDSMVVQSLEVQDRNGHWHDLRVRPYKTLDNHIEGAVITFIDIDDIKGVERLRQMQESLQETEERLRGILDNSATLIFTKDLEGRYQVVNKRVEELFGLNAEAILGKTDHEVFPREHADAYRANDQQVIARGEGMEFEECATLTGGVHTYLSVKFPIRGADNAILGIGGVATDITQRNHAQQQLERLATLVRDANDAITVQGLDGAIQAWNPAAERLYGWSESEALGMNIRDIVPPDERPALQSLIEKVHRGDNPPPIEVTRLTRAGAKVRVRLTASLLLDERNRLRAVATTEQLIT